MNLEPFHTRAGEAAALLKALANPHRLLILCYLAENQELAVTQLQQRVGLGQSALSQHLARLRDEGLVATRRKSQNIHYRVSDSRAQRLLLLLQEIYCPELGQNSRAGSPPSD